jgi:hypothetical protein
MSVAYVTLPLSTQLPFRSALRPVEGFHLPPWMVVTPSTTTASADFCFHSHGRRPPRIRYGLFPLTLAAFTWNYFDLFGLHCLLPAYPASHASLRSSCPSSPGFALRLPPHPRSRSRSCLRLAVRQVSARRSLSLPRYRPCRAYKK